MISYELSDEGIVGDEVSREGKDGMVRIVQDTLYMDLGAALSLHQWLTTHIENFRKINPGVLEGVRKDEP
ncbi:hypothetical protein [Hoeflea sp.]|uniref:hypothetical protein n=1 Tax=Hoeflea sp. TaxID=1940281 RepID=UPI0019963912|nr:hypothetical protein [Hoeflea sp.]MBC7281681.1 hypothetical protein [Hoeflea sp.]